MTKTPEAAKPFDLASLDTTKASDSGARIELVHPTSREGLGMFFTVLGKHSHIFQDLIKERVNKRVRSDSMAQRKGKPLIRTAEESEVEAIELLIACTIKWDSNGKESWLFEGEELPFNYANAKLVYTKILWIREQVDEAIGDLENFIAA